MIGDQSSQEILFLPCPLVDMIPDDHILKRVDAILDLAWLRAEVADCYDTRGGRPSIPPESVVRLMLAGFFLGIVHDRALIREAQVNLAIRWFARYRLSDPLPDHSALTRIRQRWGVERFKTIFLRTVQQCVAAGLVSGETVHIDATLIRADVSWESLVVQHADQVVRENAGAPDDEVERQLAGALAALAGLGVPAAPVYRTPHGFKGAAVFRAAARHGVAVWAWSRGVWDTDRPPADVLVRRATRLAGDRMVLLLHDGRGDEPAPDVSPMLAALPRVVDELKRRGFRFVRLDEV
jgi:transposase